METKKYVVSVHYNIAKTIKVNATSANEAERLAMQMAEDEYSDLNLWDLCDDSADAVEAED